MTSELSDSKENTLSSRRPHDMFHLVLTWLQGEKKICLWKIHVFLTLGKRSGDCAKRHKGFNRLISCICCYLNKLMMKRKAICQALIPLYPDFGRDLQYQLCHSFPSLSHSVTYPVTHFYESFLWVILWLISYSQI